MRILVLNYEYPPLGGGAGNATAHLLDQFAREDGLTIDLVTSAYGPAPAPESLTPRITIHRLDIGKRSDLHRQSNLDLLRYTVAARSYARMLCQRKAYDLVHAFFGIPCGWIARRLNLPYIVSLRGSDVPFYNPRFALLDRLVFQRLSRGIWRDAAAVVANSAGLCGLALQSSPGAAIDVIPNGVDTVRFSPAVGPAGEGGPPLRMLCVSRLIERKGIGLLIEAVATLPRGTWRLSLAGGGDKETELRERIQELGLSECVHLLGIVPREALPELYRAHDLFVLPSLNEGMSNAVLEAMASGLPIVATDTGGTAELVIAGQSGAIVPPGDVPALAHALGAYVADRDRVVSHGAAARRRAQAMSWDAVAAAYLALYHQVAEGGVR